MEHLKHAIRIAVNASQRVRDAIYLDTNAWSILAKGQAPVEPLAEWAEQNGCFLWLSRMQVAELSAQRRVVEGLANVLSRVGVMMIDGGQNEFEGKPWHQVRLDLQQYLYLNTADLRTAFIEEFMSELVPARQQLKEDGEHFRIWLSQALSSIPPTESRDWSVFPARLESWIRARCAMSGHLVNEESIRNPACYVGLRLSYSVIFQRYYINRQRWRGGDYLDYLHAADMAYSKVVVAERNLAECIRQASRRPEINGPERAFDTSWLQAPRDA